MQTINCLQCNRSFTEEDWTASISGSIMGDECTDVYYLCPVCRVYTKAMWRDNFTGVESMVLSGPVPEPQGNETIELIRRCAEPRDKHCRCDTHRTYFNDMLD